MAQRKQLPDKEGEVMKKEYSIWSEGYRITGGSGGATFHGTIKGHSFKDACINYAKKHPEFAYYFDEEKMSYWGCRLYSDEDDARKIFG